MGKRAKHRVGFKVDEAIRALHEAALTEGAVPPGDWRAKDPFHTAVAHAFQHGMQLEGNQRCTKQPCRVGGLCWALLEVMTYQQEREGPRGSVGRAADSTEDLRTAINSAVVPYVHAVAGLLKRTREQHELELRAGIATPLHAHEALCVAPKEILGDVVALLAKLDGSAYSLRSLSESSELRQSSSVKRSTLLLTAVYQHLNWGGYDPDEITLLVPMEGIGPQGAAERVRKRVEGPDARSLHPIELIPDEGSEESRKPDSSV